MNCDHVNQTTFCPRCLKSLKEIGLVHDCKTYQTPDFYLGDANVKTKITHPYSYDPITQYQGPGEANGTIYTDRLLQWDYEKHNRLCEKHFGDRKQHWDVRDPKKIEAFLQDWCEDPGLKLIKVMEYCNVSSGYPTWRLDYFQKEKFKS